ncbi:MAG: hypothetical protein QXU97_00660 [Fervidicoccaceae archaeon]
MSHASRIARDLSYAFAGSPRTSRLSLSFRLGAPSLLLASVIASWVEPSPGPNAALGLTALGWALGLSLAFEGLERTGPALRFAALFASLGLALTLLGGLAGYSVRLEGALGGALELSAAFASSSLLARWIRARDIAWISRRLGAGASASLALLGLSQLPRSLAAYSEALAAISLKLGRRRASSAVKPVVFHAVIAGRELAESIYLHGTPSPAPPRLSPSILEVALFCALAASLSLAWLAG